MTRVILGIAGYAGSGKDTAAEYLSHKYNLAQLAFASPLKEWCKTVFGFSEHQVWGPSYCRNEEVEVDWNKVFLNCTKLGMPWVSFLGGSAKEFASLGDHINLLYDTYPDRISARVVLQHIGTEFGRANFGPDVWLNATLSKVDFYVNEGAAGVVISDARFLNELSGVRNAKGRLIKVDRESVRANKIGITDHPSEMELRSLPDSYFDLVVKNNGTKSDMYSTLDSFMLCGPCRP